MRTETLELFPNFTRTIQKMKQVKNFRVLEVREATEQDIYAGYVTHVNIINGFKDEMANTTLINDVTELVHSGETLVVTRECIGDINKIWNEWVRCYFTLGNNYEQLDKNAVQVSKTLSKSIKSLDALCVNPKDEFAKDDLDSAVGYMGNYLGESIALTEEVINQVKDFRDKSYDKQYEDFDKIIAQLSKEATRQEEKRDAITARIEQLEADIKSYNASIAALAVALGVSCVMITGAFFISRGFALVITLFLLPAVAFAAIELAKIVMKLEVAKAEIAGYGDYENEYNNVIQNLNKLKGTTRDTKTEAESIKKELDDVNAPWKALCDDIRRIDELIKNSSFIDYEKMRTAFKEIEKEWEELKNNIAYLNLDASMSKVVHLDEVVADVDFLIAKAQGEGISMKEFMVA